MNLCVCVDHVIDPVNHRCIFEAIDPDSKVTLDHYVSPMIGKEYEVQIKNGKLASLETYRQYL